MQDIVLVALASIGPICVDAYLTAGAKRLFAFVNIATLARSIHAEAMLAVAHATRRSLSATARTGHAAVAGHGAQTTLIGLVLAVIQSIT